MAWQTVLEDEHERTEVFELARRGCLVRVVLPDGDQWKPVTMTWCPGLKAGDFLPAPEAAADNGAEKPAAASAPADTEDNPDAPSLVALVQTFAQVQLEVLTAFRAKMGRGSGQLGFLDHVPQVGGFSAGKQGDWVWRIDESSVSLSSRKKFIELPLPTHANDAAFSSEAVAHYLKGTGHHSVSFDGGVHPVDPSTFEPLFERMVELGHLRHVSTVPKPMYVVA